MTENRFAGPTKAKRRKARKPFKQKGSAFFCKKANLFVINCRVEWS